MIEGIGGVRYSEYPVRNEQVASKGVQAENKTHFDVQNILKQIKEYTYTEKDKEAVDKNLMESIKKQYDIEEEDVYELYKRGVDLEGLCINELQYRAQNKSLSEENQDECGENQDKSLKEKIDVIKKQSDSMYLNALKSDAPITINSLYENSFKGEVKKGISQFKKEEVDNVLAMNGLEPNKGNEWAANLLMMYDMGVSPTSISRLQGIQSAVTALDETTGVSGDDELIKNGQVQYDREYVERITDDLGMVTDEHIEKLIEEGKEINIEELRESIHKNASEALNDHKGENSEQKQGSSSGDGQKRDIYQAVDEIKRQIYQITTKLTVEAAQKISARMPLESSNLQAVAEALAQMEHEAAIDALNAVNMPTTDENIAAINEVMDAVNEVEKQFVPAALVQVDTNETATLNEMSIVLGRYMGNETPVEARFGESIKVVEDQIAHLLQSQGIEASQTNIEAAKALITNQLEVTPEGLQNIQDIVLKLNTFLEEMTPIQVAKMMKEGFNPYNASVNEILSWISQEKTEGLKTSIAEAIIEMETNGEINEKQKEGMIGLYRILQAVSTQKEQVMGYLFRNELPLTVENLQIASRYVKGKHHVEKVIDDDFGELESKVDKRETASKMLESSEESSKKVLEAIKFLENMNLPINEENVDRISKMNALLYPYIKEQFKKNVGKFEGMKTLPESFLEKLETVKNVNPEVVKSMMQNDIPLTLSNIYWMDKMNSDPEIYGELLNDKGLLKEGIPDDLDELEERLKKIEEHAKENKEEATLSGDLRSYRSYKQLEEVVHFQRQRIENEGMYQIPFVIDGERRLINLYVHEDKENNSTHEISDLKAVISYDTKSMGNVKAYIQMRGDHLGYRIEAEKNADHDVLERHAEKLIRGLNRIGYNVDYSEYVGEENQARSENQIYKNKESNFEEII